MCEKQLHPFEDAGLGVAPFRFVGVENRVGPISLGNGVTVGAPGQPMGVCDYCSQGIKECCIIQDSTGKTFVVGNVCVGKTCSEKFTRYVKKQVNKVRTEIRHEKEAARIKAAKEILENPEIKAHFSNQPHPSDYQAGKGKTGLDYIEWMFYCAGNAGMIKVSKMIEKVAKDLLAASD